MNKTNKLISFCAIVGAIGTICQIGEYVIRMRAEAPSITMSGRFCHLLTQENFRDVLRSLYDAWPFMKIVENDFANTADERSKLRERFCDESEFRLFKLVIQNKHNVPVSVSEFNVRDLSVSLSNTNLTVRNRQLFVAFGEKRIWETSPIIYLGPHESRQLEIVVSFIAIDWELDGTKINSRPAMSVAEWRAKRFSQAVFKSLRFAVRDNLGKEYSSNLIPIHDHVVAE
jgi:hypothetical protein